MQTEFETTLGPMPDDALLEMTRTGALLRTDRVRSEGESAWRLASEIPGLFEAINALPLDDAPSNFVAATETPVPGPVPSRAPVVPQFELVPPTAPATVVSPAIHDEPVTSTPLLQPVATTRTIDAEPEARPKIAPSRERPASATAPPENDLIASWKSERRQSQEDLGLISLASEITNSEEDDDFAPELPSDLLDELAPPVADEAAPTNPAPRSVVNRPAFLDQIAGLEDGPRLRPETARQKWERWQRSLPSWPVAVAIVLAVWLVWSNWPRSQRAIFDRYVAIWDEWQTRRVNSKDSEGWANFLKRTEAELDNTVPWLEQHARASDREKLLLLWVGRDCFRKMLKRPRQIGSPEEKQLEILLTNIREYYRSPDSGTGGLAPGSNSDPERPAAAGAFDPGVGRSDAKSTSPNTETVPANTNVPPTESVENRR